MKRFIFIFMVLVFPFFGCKKKTVTQTNTPNYINYAYAAKYTPLMGGNRVWHRYYTYFKVDSSMPTRVNLSDTTGSITIIDNTTIGNPFIGDDYIVISNDLILQSDTSGVLYFLVSETFVDRSTLAWQAYYFPANDSICLIRGSSQAPWYYHYYHSP